MELLPRIKFYLRNNPFYQRIFQSTVNDIRFWFMQLPIYKHRYFWHKDFEVHEKALYFIIDPTTGFAYPGLADRLKVIVCAYYLAQICNRKFRLIFESPFDLSKYFMIGDDNCMKGDWKDISYSLKNSRILPFNGQSKIPRLNNNIMQYHIYKCHGKNMLENNNIPNWKEVWGSCFNELFKPSEILQQTFEATGLTRRKYISAHLRFVNALEHFEDGHYNNIAVNKKEELMSNCLKELHKIKGASNFPLVVFSDSDSFLSHAKKDGFIVLSGKVGHVSYQTDDDTVLKAFTDFYTMSQSAKVYRIIAKGMYRTTFSYYAALSGMIECETRDI